MLLDVAGRDASDEFEQLGHSDEAREMVAALLVGTLRRGVLLNLFAICAHVLMIGLQEAKVAPVSGKKSAPKVDVAIAAFTTKSSRGLDLQVFVYVMLVLFAVMMLGLQRYL